MCNLIEEPMSDDSNAIAGDEEPQCSKYDNHDVVKEIGKAQSLCLKDTKISHNINTCIYIMIH